MISLAYKLPKVMSIFPIKIALKKLSRNNVDISTRKMTSKQVHENNLDFSTIEITSKKVRGNNVDFSTIEITSKKYVETTWLFRPVKLCRKKYVETTWIFQSVKLHRKSTWKWRGNLWKFVLRRINVISTSNRCDSTWCARWETTRFGLRPFYKGEL